MHDSSLKNEDDLKISSSISSSSIFYSFYLKNVHHRMISLDIKQLLFQAFLSIVSKIMGVIRMTGFK